MYLFWDDCACSLLVQGVYAFKILSIYFMFT